MKRIAILVSVLLLQLSAVGAATADGDSSPGLYVQGAFAMQATTGDVKDGLESFGSDANFYGGSLALGYFVTDWMAIQARLQFLSGPNASMLGASLDTWNMLYSGAVKVYPFNLGGSAGGLLQPYGIFGIGGQTLFATASGGGLSATDSETAFLLEVGGGLDLMLSNHVGVFGEVTYEYLNSSSLGFDGSTNAVGVNIGVTYRF